MGQQQYFCHCLVVASLFFIILRKKYSRNLISAASYLSLSLSSIAVPNPYINIVVNVEDNHQKKSKKVGKKKIFFYRVSHSFPGLSSVFFFSLFQSLNQS